MNHLRTLARYKAWADALFLTTVATLPAEVLMAPRPIVFGSLIRTLNHLQAMDHVWRCHLLGKPHGLTTRNPEQHPDIETLTAQQRELDDWYVSYADSIGERESDDVVEFDYIGGGRGTMTRGEILLHVVNHTTYHRGHAADILYNLGVSPPTTDLPVFLREQRAGA